MKRAVILDGWHRGTVIVLPALLPEIRVPQASTVRFLEKGEGIVRDRIDVTYKMVFSAVDGAVALYSRTGESLDFLNADAVHPILVGNRFGVREPLNYFIKVKDDQS